MRAISTTLLVFLVTIYNLAESYPPTAPTSLNNSKREGDILQELATQQINFDLIAWRWAAKDKNVILYEN